MPAIRQDQAILRLAKQVNDIWSALRRVTVNLPLFDIANENTPTQLMADQDDYVPGNYDILRLSSDQAGRAITGFSGGVKGRSLRLFNTGDYEIYISNQSASSSASNRIISPTGFDIVLNAGGELVLYYDTSIQRWISTYNSNADRISVVMRLSANMTIADATHTRISWDDEVKDTGGFFDVANPEYVTIPETGWYNVFVHYAWEVNGTNVREQYSEQDISLPTFKSLVHDVRVAATGVQTQISLSRTDYFLIGTKIYSTVWQNSGGNLDILRQGSSTSYTTLTVVKL